jgi:hypothetical protein
MTVRSLALAIRRRLPVRTRQAVTGNEAATARARLTRSEIKRPRLWRLSRGHPPHRKRWFRRRLPLGVPRLSPACHGLPAADLTVGVHDQQIRTERTMCHRLPRLCTAHRLNRPSSARSPQGR